MRSILFLLLFCFVISLPGYAADRSLIVGVEKYKYLSAGEGTPGCVEDARSMDRFIRSEYGFTEVKVLLNEEATAANIQHWFKTWLIDGTNPGDRVFFFYAGHGSQLPDDNGDETEDKRDETIAPYDVMKGTGANQIRDDVFDGFIAQLSGRRAVLIFDSCHSGTISRGTPKFTLYKQGGGVRYLPSPDQLEQFKATGSRGPGDDGYIVQAPQRGSRDLELEGDFIDPSRFEKTSGIVIVSAAGDRQQAFPIEVHGQFHGALSRVFIETHDLYKKQNHAPPSIAYLEQTVKAKLKSMQDSGQLDGVQVPVFTPQPRAMLYDRPLFATWAEAPMIALVNPLSKIKLDIRTRENKRAYIIGETISYEVEADTPGYLYLVVFSQKNVASCIFPNSEDLNNQIPAGRVSVPRSTTYDFPIQEPIGRDVVVALLSKQKLNLGDKVEYTWQEVFERLNLKELRDKVTQEATRGVGVNKTGGSLGAGDWQGSFMILETKPRI